MMCSLTRTWGRRRMWWVRSVQRGWLAPYWAKVEGICVLSRATGNGSGCEFVRDEDARSDVV